MYDQVRPERIDRHAREVETLAESFQGGAAAKALARIVSLSDHDYIRNEIVKHVAHRASKVRSRARRLRLKANAFHDL